MNEKARPKMTPEAKRKLHELLYYVAMNNRPRGGFINYTPMVCYISARNQANYCLEALGERLDEC